MILIQRASFVSDILKHFVAKPISVKFGTIICYYSTLSSIKASFDLIVVFENDTFFGFYCDVFFKKDFGYLFFKLQ